MGIISVEATSLPKDDTTDFLMFDRSSAECDIYLIYILFLVKAHSNIAVDDINIKINNQLFKGHMENTIYEV